MNGKVGARLVLIALGAGLLSAPAGAGQNAQAAATSAPGAAKSQDNYDVLFQQYLNAARNTPVSRSMWMSGLFGDLRARSVNDLLTINVIESVSAQGSADSSLDKNSSASAAVSNFFGAEKKVPTWLNLSNLASLSTNTDFKGGGSTQRSGTLQAVMTARVAEVFPNGDLGVEGIREIDINGDRQIIVVTGVVRPVDVQAGNVVLSTSIGQMRIRYFGRGLIKDNLNPGWLVRALNKIF